MGNQEGVRVGDMDFMVLHNGEVFGGVIKFYYFGVRLDRVNGEGGGGSAVTARVRCRWNKFRELFFYTNAWHMAPRHGK